MLCITSPSHDLALLELQVSNIAFSQSVRRPDFKKSTILCLAESCRIASIHSFTIFHNMHITAVYVPKSTSFTQRESNLLGYLHFSLTRLNHSISSLHNHSVSQTASWSSTSIYSCLIEPLTPKEVLKPTLLSGCYLWASTR